MQIKHEAARMYTQALECLKVSELLAAEATAKLQRAEGTEALELWGEALAYQREGFALLDAASARNLMRESREQVTARAVEVSTKLAH